MYGDLDHGVTVFRTRALAEATYRGAGGRFERGRVWAESTPTATENAVEQAIHRRNSALASTSHDAEWRQSVADANTRTIEYLRGKRSDPR